MPSVLTTVFCAAALALLTSISAQAQTPAKGGQKTIGGKPAAGKLMTKDELRTCFARRDALNENAKKIETSRTQMDAERAELLKEGEAVKADREAVEKRLAAVRDLQTRFQLHAVAIEAFNKRMAEYNDASADRKKEMDASINAEREHIDKVTAQLKTEEAERVPAYQASVKAYNERAAARDAKVVSWNDRQAVAVKPVEDHQQAHQAWTSECANRPYREDDEIAIKAGK